MIETIMRYRSPPGISGTSSGTSSTITGVLRRLASISAMAAATITAHNSPFNDEPLFFPRRKINQDSAPPQPIRISFLPRS